MPFVTDSAAPPAPLHASGAGEAAWNKVRAMGDIQFTPLTPPPRKIAENPRWLTATVEWLSRHMAPFGNWLAEHFRAVEIGGAILLVLLVVWMIWGSLRGFKRTGRAAQTAEAGIWRPDTAMATALLSDADRLAAEGRFDEAVHLLLRRSFDDIALTRPDWLTPASTAREIARLGALPAAARMAFGVITVEVERSRYALHPLGQPDWSRARAAYADFAVPGRGLA